MMAWYRNLRISAQLAALFVLIMAAVQIAMTSVAYFRSSVSMQDAGLAR